MSTDPTPHREYVTSDVFCEGEDLPCEFLCLKHTFTALQLAQCDQEELELQAHLILLGSEALDYPRVYCYSGKGSKDLIYLHPVFSLN